MDKIKTVKKTAVVFSVLLLTGFSQGCAKEKPLPPAYEENDPVIPLVRTEEDDGHSKAEAEDDTGHDTGYDAGYEAEDDIRHDAGDDAGVTAADENTETDRTETEINVDMGDIKDKGFYVTEITDDIFARIYGKSFKEDCTLPREDLRYLHVLHKDIEGISHEGEMIVNMHIADDVLDIMEKLYENDYPIEKIRLVDEYDADDELSMEDNNSSCFNFRFVPRTKKVSKHGMGLAVDINTLYNPYITTVDGRQNVDPKGAEPYVDREARFDYKIEKGDLCYNLFTEHGFEWGGEWKNSKDYQHFEIPTEKINEWYRQ